jgi:hypothetical protein
VTLFNVQHTRLVPFSDSPDASVPCEIGVLTNLELASSICTIFLSSETYLTSSLIE